MINIAKYLRVFRHLFCLERGQVPTIHLTPVFKTRSSPITQNDDIILVKVPRTRASVIGQNPDSQAAKGRQIPWGCPPSPLWRKTLIGALGPIQVDTARYLGYSNFYRSACLGTMEIPGGGAHLITRKFQKGRLFTWKFHRMHFSEWKFQGGA